MAREINLVEFVETRDRGKFDLYLDRRIADYDLTEDEFVDALHRARVPRGLSIITPAGVAAPRW